MFEHRREPIQVHLDDGTERFRAAVADAKRTLARDRERWHHPRPEGGRRA